MKVWGLIVGAALLIAAAAFALWPHTAYGSEPNCGTVIAPRYDNRWYSDNGCSVVIPKARIITGALAVAGIAALVGSAVAINREQDQAGRDSAS
jgi:hypothetical protein